MSKQTEAQKYPRLSIRISQKVLARLKAAAATDHRKPGAMARLFIERALAAQKEAQ